jgi:RNA polymerase sigma-70 factor (ECF subfamily)
MSSGNDPIPQAEHDELLAAARRFDTRALAEIHDRYYGDVYRYLLYRTRDECVAEDLASEVFVRLLDALRRGTGPDVLGAWLFGVAGHLAVDHFRRLARRPQAELHDGVPDASSDVEGAAGAGIAQEHVRAALQTLTDEQQQVLALRFGEGRSLAETAGLMQKSVTAVKQLQFRAVAALRRKLGGLL